MKHIKIYFIILLVFIMFTISSLESYAMETGFETETMSQEEKNEFIKNISISKLLEEPKKQAIVCFDVNDDYYAIGYSNNQSKTICVYSVDGIFQYGYNFKTSGSFSFELTENSIIIYSVRGDNLFELSSDGKLLDLCRVTNTTENSIYHDKTISKKRHIGEKEYKLKNNYGIFNFFVTSYSQLICVDENGNETVLHDVSSTEYKKVIFSIIAGAIFVFGVITNVIILLIKANKSGKSQPTIQFPWQV